MVVTPLHHALCNSEDDIAKLLIQSGAAHIKVYNRHLKDNTHLPEAAIASGLDGVDLLQELVEDNTDVQPPDWFLDWLK